MTRRGFTIIELMMVIGIIAVLMGIVISTASGSIKSARQQKASAVVKMVQAGLSTYYAQKGEWPGPVGSRAKSGSMGSLDGGVYTLSASEVRETVKALVEESRRGNPVLDISGLFVSRHEGERGSHDIGMDFMTAIRGTKKNPKKMKLAEMNFGVPEKEHGYFRRLTISYQIATDSMTVGHVKD